jgi:site-specific DNA-cytosine methylase
MKDNIRLLYVDLFCGAGGTSTGIEQATIDGQHCAKVVACVDHDAHAIESHAANHPDAMHFTEDIRTLNLAPLVAHLQSERAKHPAAKTVLWASLECTNFSRAKGGLPRDADSRTLAEHLFRYIEDIKPDYIQIECGLAIEVYETDSPMTRKIKEFMALYGITDIKMRMLKISELKAIMGFPTDYRLVGTQCEQKKFIGNAVEVNMSRVLCEALAETIKIAA